MKVENHEIYRKKDSYIDLLHKVSEELKLPKSLIENYDAVNHIFVEDLKEQKKPCAVCLGILQDVDKSEWVNEVAYHLKHEGYEFNSFKLTIKIPMATCLRYTQMAYYARKMLSSQIMVEDKQSLPDEISVKEAIDIKTVYKWVFPSKLVEYLNCKVNADDKFNINIFYNHDIADQADFAKYKSILHSVNEKEAIEKIEKKLKVNPNYAVSTAKVMKKPDPNYNNMEKIVNLTEEIVMSVNTTESNEYYPPPQIETRAEALFTCTNTTAYVMGHYLKFSRELSQTPWEIDGKKMYPTSIEEEIAKWIHPYYKSDSYKFHSGGREDIDVRMLGGGRPFCLEFTNPRRILTIGQKELTEMEKSINESPDVNVRDLYITDDTCFARLKESETEKIKSYCAVVYCKRALKPEDLEPLNKILDLKVQQKTPLRVLHRRTQMVRTKIIHKIRPVWINEHFLKVYLLSSAGTYIKEFVHSDLERTTPNLGTLLGADCDILQLDVFKLYAHMNEEVLKDFLEISV
jgi:tRNA pseudouridine synthase 10